MKEIDLMISPYVEVAMPLRYPNEQNDIILNKNGMERFFNEIAYSADLAIPRFLYLFQGSRREELVNVATQEFFEHVLFHHGALLNMLSTSPANYDAINKFLDESLNDFQILMAQKNPQASQFLKILKHPERYSKMEKENSEAAFKEQQRLGSAFLFLLQTKQRLFKYGKYTHCQMDQADELSIFKKVEKLERWQS